MVERHRRPDSRSPYPFVVGCPRSGTTLLQRMLDAHPELAVANDTHFIARAVEAVAPAWLPAGPAGDEPPELTAALIAWARGYHRFGRLGLGEAAVARAAQRATSFAEFVRALYEELARSRGKRLAGEKTPDYVRHLPLLHVLFPGARTVHVVRDGRDVTLSLLEWARDGKGPGRFDLWREEPVAVCALWWRWQVGHGRADGPALGPGAYLELSYEALVADPEPELRRLCDFLNLSFDRTMASYHVGRQRRSPGRSAKQAWLPPTPGLRDWRRQMGARDLALFEALAGDRLAELGYAVAAPRIPDEVAATAARGRAWWEATLARRAAKHRARAATLLAASAGESAS